MLNLKNKTERENFLKEYSNWDIFLVSPALRIKIFKYQFQNGAIVYATEYQHYDSYRKSFRTQVVYHLILKMSDEYTKNSCCGNQYLVSYEPSGNSFGTIVDYMTKNKEVI